MRAIGRRRIPLLFVPSWPWRCTRPAAARTTNRFVPRSLLMSFAIVLGSSLVLTATATPGEHVDSRRQERWHLWWNVVDRGIVSSGQTGTFTSGDDCRASQQRAVQR